MIDLRPRLPQLENRLFLTDSGLETTLMFRDGMSLPEFAAFPLLEDPDGRERLRDYFGLHLDIARSADAGFVAESPTWRANREWGDRLGYDAGRLAAANRAAISLLVDLRERARQPLGTFVISGCIGPRGDGYVGGEEMSVRAAESYHRAQVQTFADTPVDLVSALTLTSAAEAIGVTRAGQACGIPVVISFTVETDGHLPDGSPLGRTIRDVDEATGCGPAYYMINCAHPTHFAPVLRTRKAWTSRVRGIRANASVLSHAELDAAITLDDGNPERLGSEYAELVADCPQLTILGGCCWNRRAPRRRYRPALHLHASGADAPGLGRGAGMIGVRPAGAEQRRGSDRDARHRTSFGLGRSGSDGVPPANGVGPVFGGPPRLGQPAITRCRQLGYPSQAGLRFRRTRSRRPPGHELFALQRSSLACVRHRRRKPTLLHQALPGTGTDRVSLAYLQAGPHRLRDGWLRNCLDCQGTSSKRAAMSSTSISSPARDRGSKSLVSRNGEQLTHRGELDVLLVDDHLTGLRPSPTRCNYQPAAAAG